MHLLTGCCRLLDAELTVRSCSFTRAVSICYNDHHSDVTPRLTEHFSCTVYNGTNDHIYI